MRVVGHPQLANTLRKSWHHARPSEDFDVKDLSEVVLSPHDKEWLKRHAREHKWTVAKLQEDLLKKKGQHVDPASIRKFINTTRNEWLSRTNESRTRGDRQATARADVEKQLLRVARRGVKNLSGTKTG
jgi:hypothetical protein